MFDLGHPVEVVEGPYKGWFGEVIDRMEARLDGERRYLVKIDGLLSPVRLNESELRAVPTSNFGPL